MNPRKESTVTLLVKEVSRNSVPISRVKDQGDLTMCNRLGLTVTLGRLMTHSPTEVDVGRGSEKEKDDTAFVSMGNGR